MKHLFHMVRRLLMVLLAISVVTLLALRYWILPNVEGYHADIIAAASAAIGHPVEISQIKADWNGLRPRLLLTDLRILDDRGQVALELPHLRNTVAWTSLLHGELRFYSIELDRPELEIRRDTQGKFYVGGILASEQSKVSSSGDGSDWLLHQSNITIHNGSVVWRDEQRTAPTLRFEQVEIAIQNRWNHHRFSFRATPPSKLASRVDVRGDVHGSSFSNRQDWSGELFGKFEHVDTSAWMPWISFPRQFKRGNGAARAWLGIAEGQINQADVDVDFHEVDAQLASDLPSLALDRLNGRVAWQKTPEGFVFSTQKMALRLADGFEIKPTDFSLSVTGAQDYRSASGEVRANVLDLGDIGKLLQYLPLEANLKKQLADFAPQGKITDLDAHWQGALNRAARYRVHANFSNVGIRQLGDQPGFSGLSGKVSGSDNEGVLELESHDLYVQAPSFLSEPLLFEQVVAHLDWQRNGSGWDLKLNKTHVRNADMDGSVSGSYQINDGPGVADLTLNLSRASVKHVARYIPKHAFNDATYHWLQTGLQEGTADAFQMRVRGDLREFPFPDSKNGLFKLEAKANEVAIEFVPGWPRIEHAAANLLIQGRRLEVGATKAMTGGAKLQNVKVVLPDVLADELMMQVNGDAADETQRSLDYIRNSPVRGYLDGYTDGFKARGEGLLKLKLDIPLTGKSPLKVLGSYRFEDNEVDLGEHVPLLSNASGMLTFTNDDLHATGIKAQILGGPARIDVSSVNGVLTTQASGKLNSGNLPATYTYPLLKRIHGTADWTTEVKVKNKLADVLVTSDLQGLISDLPQPFTKAAKERIKISFEQKDMNAKMDVIRLHYGEVINAELSRTPSAQGGWEIKRGSVVLGQGLRAESKEGILVSGELPRFSLEGWNGWAQWPNREGVLPNIAGINVTVGTLIGYGNLVHQLSIKGSGRNGLISTRLTSREVNGDLIWQPQDQGRLLVRLKNAMLGESAASVVAQDVVPTLAVSPEQLEFPDIDVTIEKLTWKGRAYGKLELLAKTNAEGVVLEKFHLTNPDAVMSASGTWHAAPQQTHLDVKFDIANAGKLLVRAGFPESVKDGASTLEGNLTWNGSPDEFNYASLNGTVKLKTGKGRFMQVNPGAAKLLGVLSLQSLPKRIALDFTDVFSPGFEFENIAGDALIEQGLLKTSNFKMDGAAAKVLLSGQVNLARETQTLKVRVMPAIGDNVSLLSFAAGPAVGMSVLLANKILSDPLDKLVSFDYNVSGSWDEPQVVRASAAKAVPASGQ